MRRWLVTLALLAACKSPAPEAAPPAPAPPPPVPRLDSKAIAAELMAQQRAANPAPQLPDRWQEHMTELIAKSSGRERELLERMLVIARQPDAQEPRKAMLEVIGILRELAGMYPDDLEINVRLVSSLAMLVQVGPSMGIDVAPLIADLGERGPALTARFPKEARAHASAAVALLATEADELTVLRELVACLALDPAHEYCRTTAHQVRRSYTTPRCDGASVRQALKAVLATKSGKGPAVTWPGALDTYHLGDTLLTAGDIASVSGNPDDDVLLVTLTAAGRQKLTTASRAMEHTFDGALVLYDGDKLLYGAAVQSRIDGGKLNLVEVGSIDVLCSQVTRRELPAELR
jgi:hypothetical protein